MSNKNFELEISKIENEIERVKTEMTPAAQEVIAGVKSFVTIWYDREIKYAVEKQADRTAILSASGGLKQMKEKFKELSGALSTLVDQEFADNSHWSHLQSKLPENQRSYDNPYNFSSGKTVKLSSAFKKLLLPAVTLLRDFGYDTHSHKHFGSNHPNYRYSGDVGYEFVNSIGANRHDSLTEPLKKYEDLHKKLGGLYFHLEATKRQMDEHKAKSAWDGL